MTELRLGTGVFQKPAYDAVSPDLRSPLVLASCDGTAGMPKLGVGVSVAGDF